MEVEGDLIAHDWGTEIRLDVSGLQFCQTYRVTLENEDGERVNVGTIIGTGDKTVKPHVQIPSCRARTRPGWRSAHPAAS